MENSIIEFSECLFDLLFINDMGNINNTSNQAQNSYFDYSKGHSKGISSGTLSDQEADEKILQTQYKTQIDFKAEKEKEDFSKLAINLTQERKLIELSNLILFLTLCSI